MRRSCRPDAAKPDVAAGRLRCVAAAGGNAVAPAVRVVAKVRPAAHRPGLSPRRAAGVGAFVTGVEGRMEPVCTPLPDIPCHVVEAEAVRRELADRAGAEEPVLQRVVPRERALPHVHPVLAIRLEVISPGEPPALQSSACGVLPFGLSG